MGTDICGGVEIRPGGQGTPWLLSRIDVEELPRDYDSFGLLFGVRNFAGFTPVAPGRGVPADASLDLLKGPLAFAEHDHTWITWTELAAMDWSRPAPAVDARIHQYQVTGTGPVKVGKAACLGPHWATVAGVGASDRGTSYPEGTEWRNDDMLYRVERLVPDEVLAANPPLRALLDTMRTLGERHGGDNVRLVVGFNS